MSQYNNIAKGLKEIWPAENYIFFLLLLLFNIVIIIVIVIVIIIIINIIIIILITKVNFARNQRGTDRTLTDQCVVITSCFALFFFSLRYSIIA